MNEGGVFHDQLNDCHSLPIEFRFLLLHAIIITK